MNVIMSHSYDGNSPITFAINIITKNNALINKMFTYTDRYKFNKHTLEFNEKILYMITKRICKLFIYLKFIYMI